MPTGKMRPWLLLLLAGAWLLPPDPTSSRQQERKPREALITLGMLTCSLTVAPDASPAAPTRDVLCHFTPGSEGSQEVYVGTMQGVGQMQALFGKGAVILAVKGPSSTRIVPGLLQQTFSAEASLATAAPPLTGEKNSTVLLQPWTEQEGRVAAGNARPDAAIITVELRLQSSPA
jgi:hypothetical protein